MKTIYKVLIGAAALVALLSSCNNKIEYKSVPFVVLGSKSANVKEDAGKVSVDVVACNLTAPCTVTYTIKGDAVTGKHYKMADNSGVINFNESGSQTIEFEIINHPNEYLGNASLKLEIAEVSEGVEIGAVKAFSMNILDNDIPVDWTFVEGQWTAQDYEDGAPSGSAYKVDIKKIDETTVSMINLWDGGTAITGTISFDKAANTATMGFTPMQNIFDATAYGYGQLMLLGHNGDNWSTTAPAQASVTAAGIEMGPWGLLITAGQYAGYLYGGYTTTFTK